jgi:hypothetical protein
MLPSSGYDRTEQDMNAFPDFLDTDSALVLVAYPEIAMLDESDAALGLLMRCRRQIKCALGPI